ncbi:MAG: MFS transporter [Flavobacteriales bacterium]|nr:MFS transporter [Flavobacteriales bacterium]
MKEKVYSPLFIRMALGSLLFFGSMNMILPELPAYLDSMGGDKYKGGIIGLFTISACFSRPFSGRLSDVIGRLPVIMFGCWIAVATNVLYIFVPTVAGFLILRLIHGITIGFNATGTTAYISDISPPSKRGEAMGFFGLMNNVGAGLAPLLGSFLTVRFGINSMFITSSLLALASTLIFLKIHETVPEPQKFRPGFLKLKRQDLAESRVWLPSVIMVLSYFSFGAILTVGFDLAEMLHAVNKGVVLMIMTLSSVFIRISAGKFSDRHGRKTSMILGLAILVIGLIYMAGVQSLNQLYMASFIVGVANGMNSPTIFAWVADWSNPANKGRGISTLFIALEIGVGLGAFVSADLYQNNYDKLPGVFYFAALLASSAIVLLVLTWKYRPKLILD